MRLRGRRHSLFHSAVGISVDTLPGIAVVRFLFIWVAASAFAGGLVYDGYHDGLKRACIHSFFEH